MDRRMDGRIDRRTGERARGIGGWGLQSKRRRDASRLLDASVRGARGERVATPTLSRGARPLVKSNY